MNQDSGGSGGKSIQEAAKESLCWRSGGSDMRDWFLAGVALNLHYFICTLRKKKQAIAPRRPCLIA
jgi:hypothetical protein